MTVRLLLTKISMYKNKPTLFHSENLIYLHMFLRKNSKHVEQNMVRKHGTEYGPARTEAW